MKRWLTLVLMLTMLLSGTTRAEESPRKVFYKGEVPDFAPEEIRLELLVAQAVGADGMILISGEDTMVVDTCTAVQYEKLAQLIRERGIKQIDHAFNTHPDCDHLGGMTQLVKDFSVDRMITVYEENYSGPVTIQYPTITELKKEGIPVVKMADGDEIQLGDARVKIYRQTKNQSSTNQLSAMLMVEVGNCRILLTGDAENRAQRVYTNDGYDLKADIMKYPHHGVSVMERDFLEAVSPEAVFIPHSIGGTKEARWLLGHYGIPYGLAGFGPFRITTNGEYWIIEHRIDPKFERQMKDQKIPF